MVSNALFGLILKIHARNEKNDLILFYVLISGSYNDERGKEGFLIGLKKCDMPQK